MNQPLAPNTLIGNRYRIEQLLGQGGMGAVYKAWDLRLTGHTVAVKENFETTHAAQTQFQTEAVLLANLQHPMLPRVTDRFIEPSGRQYLVMDFVAGDDLEQIVTQRGKLDQAQAIVWLTQILNALEYLHTQPQPIIHRDIKPANIKIRPDGRAVLVDFGIAKVQVAGQKTVAGAQAYSPGYSPLEQYGHGSTDARSDIYSLGATCYFLLTGRTPPEARDLATGAETLTPTSQLGAPTTSSVENAIRQAMAMQPAQRFQTVAAFRDALNPQVGTQRIYVPTATPASRGSLNVQANPSAPVNSPPPASAVPSPAIPRHTPSPRAVTPRAQSPVTTPRYLVTIAACGIGGAILIVIAYFIGAMLGYGLFFSAAYGFVFALPGALAYLFTFRPGAAFLASVLASVILPFIGGGDLSSWAIYISAAAMELTFTLFQYRNNNIRLVIGAAVIATLVGFGNGMIQYRYGVDIATLLLEVAGSALGGAAAFFIWKRLTP